LLKQAILSSNKPGDKQVDTRHVAWYRLLLETQQGDHLLIVCSMLGTL